MPYAHARRFEAPVDFEGTYNGTLDATYFGPACLQYYSPKETYGVEDCFVMNVWKPLAAKPGE